MDNNQNPQNAQDNDLSIDAILDGDQGVQGSVFDDLANELNNGNDGEQGAAQGNLDGVDPNKSVDVDNPPSAGDNTQPPANEDDLIALLNADDNLLSADDREFKTAVYDKFQAVKVDFKGNLLNQNGEVVLNADDFENYIQTGAVPVDAEGNQVNAKGEIVATADSIKGELNMVDTTKLFLEQDLGYTFTDAEGKPKSYPNTIEGMQQFSKDVAITAQVSAVSSFLDTRPQLKSLFFHLENGGTIADYASKEVDYATIDVTSLTKEQKLDYIKQSYERQGVKNVSSIMDLLENVGEEKMTQSVSEAILSLKEVSDRERLIEEQNYNKAQEEAQKEADIHWANVKSVIDKGTLQSFQIANSDKGDFYKYIAEPINNKGETREMLDADKETSEQQLLISYLRFKGGDISKLVANKAALNRVQALRERMGKNVPMPTSSNSRERQGGNTSDVFVPSIDNLLG